MKKSQFIKAISLFAFTLLLTATSFAQPDKNGNKKERYEKIEKLKISFITNELDLSTEEAEKFWPLYNEMSKKLKSEKRIQRNTTKELRTESETLSDKDFKTKTDLIFDSQAKEAALKKEYTGKIAGIIGYKKAAKLLSLDQRFKKELLNKINRQEHSGKPSRPNGSDRLE